MRDMVTFGFVKGDTAKGTLKFYTLKANAPKRGAVTTFAGKVGKPGRKTVLGFAERADMRKFVADKINAKLADGFVRIA